MALSKGCAVRRPSWRNRLFPLALLLAAMPLFAADAETELSTSLSRIDPPLQAPDFTLNDMDGTPHTLSGYRGRVVLLNFWATWCPPCRREMPSLDRVYRRLNDRGLMVLAVNQWESDDLVFSYMGDLEVFPEFPILFDRESSVSEEYGVRGLPTSFILDTRGRIVYKAIGGRAFDDEAITALIEELLP